MTSVYESERDRGAAERPALDTTSDEQIARLVQLEEQDEARTDWRLPRSRAESPPRRRHHSPRAMLRRLAGVTFVPHVLHINHALPSSDVEHSSRARLEEKIALYGLVEKKVAGDGNCQFRALSDQLFGTAEHHGYIRSTVVRRLNEHPEEYRPYVPGDWQEYLSTMRQSGTWGDNITLQAFADAMGLRVNIISSYTDSCVIEITPSTPVRQRRPLWISFWAEIHYNSLYPDEELPEEEKEEHGHSFFRLLAAHRLAMLCRSCPVVVS